MATFHDFDPLALWGFLTSGRYVRCPAGRTLLAEGAPSAAYYLTINGAVEQVLVRGDRRIRVDCGAGGGVRIRGPHRRSAHPPSRRSPGSERSYSSVPRDLFERLFDGEDSVSRGFLDVIHKDLMANLRDAAFPAARLTASGLAEPSVGPSAYCMRSWSSSGAAETRFGPGSCSQRKQAQRSGSAASRLGADSRCWARS